MLRMIITLVLAMACCQPARCQTLKLLVWNVQNDGSFSSTIRDELQELHGEYEFDLVGLSEVDSDNVLRYRDALTDASGSPFEASVSQTGGGGGDFLVILHNAGKLTRLDTIELAEFADHKMNFKNSPGQFRFRSPFVAQFRHNTSRIEFLFLVNHLIRGSSDNPQRDSQVKGLNAWASAQSLPVIMGGDLNLDVDVNSRQGNSSADVIFADASPWKWLEPVRLIDTNWADDPDQPGQQDRFPDSILDFVFTATQASSWPASSQIIVREGDFPDGESRSDHRPLLATFGLPGSAAPPAASALATATRGRRSVQHRSATESTSSKKPKRMSAEAHVRAAIVRLDARISRLNSQLASASPAQIEELRRLLEAKLQLLGALEILAFSTLP